MRLNSQAVSLRDELRTMIDTLAHRGPDGLDCHEDGPIGLAHARLSIIDVDGGSQPMPNEDQSVWTVCNGEIFNYLELREELTRQGHVFRTRSDTEVIVHAYEQYGQAFVQRLNGQFAIALWDANRERLILARDRVGVRPLFVQQEGDRWLFASEVKALLAVSRQPRRLDLQGLAQVFSLWATVGERTAFEGVRSVPAGHMLRIENGREVLTKYWDWSDGETSASVASFDEASEELRELLADAVRLQLRSDVPFGAYLSGGLDSSIIAAMIRKQSTAPLRTFSVVFEDAEYDESGYQQIIARHLDADHTPVLCRRADIGAIFPRLIAHLETPVLRTAPAPLMILSAAVRNAGIKVALTGEGADEVFAGYDVFKEAQIRRFWARDPDSLQRPRLLRRLYPYLKHSPVAAAEFAQSFFGRDFEDTSHPFYAHAQRWTTTKRIWRVFSSEARSAIASADPEAELHALLPAGFARMQGLSRDQWIEAQTLLSGYLLSSQGDRVAMANSVEGRVPFLDHRIIELANRLPPRYKMRGLREKLVLRHAVKDLLPASIAQRAKQPYRSPDSLSFFAHGRAFDFAAEMLSPACIKAAGYFDPAAVRTLVEKCRAGRAIGFTDNMAFVGVLSTMVLHETFIRRRSAIPATPSLAYA